MDRITLNAARAEAVDELAKRGFADAKFDDSHPTGVNAYAYNAADRAFCEGFVTGWLAKTSAAQDARDAAECPVCGGSPEPPCVCE